MTRRHTREYLERICSPAWEQVRSERIAKARGRCERCRRYRPGRLQLHHKHYRTLGRERHEDLELLCVTCHVDADRERQGRVRRERERHRWGRMARAQTDPVRVRVAA